MVRRRSGTSVLTLKLAIAAATPVIGAHAPNTLSRSRKSFAILEPTTSGDLIDPPYAAEAEP